MSDVERKTPPGNSVGSKDKTESEFTPFQLFNKAVDDAQYMVLYAAGQCDDTIDDETLLPLLRTKYLLEEGKKVNAEQEKEFWLAYQKIWEMVKPATAESIKANFPMETTISSRLIEKTPILSRFGQRKTISKSSAAVNWYTGVTIFFLLLLLAFQIYWVIGNQLTTQLAELLQKGTDLNVQISENQKEYDTIEILYKQNEAESFKTTGTYTFYSSPEWEREILENISTRVTLESELESLKSQMERSYSLLSIWSRPWDDLFEEGIPTENDKYTSQITDITAQIETIKGQIDGDKDGSLKADSLNGALTPQLESIQTQLANLYAANDQITIQQTDIQVRAQEINDRLAELSGDDAARSGSEGALQAQLDALSAQLADLDAIKKVVQGQKDEIRAKLDALVGVDGADPIQISALESQLKELDVQLTNLQTSQTTITGQKEEINNQLVAIKGDDAARESRKNDLMLQLNDLTAQLQGLDANRTVIVDQIQSLQAQSNGLIAQLVSPEQIVNQREQDLSQLTNTKNALERQALVDSKREESRKAQLAGQFVLNILQGYVLPLFYGVLGAATYILRHLSREIEDVKYTEGTRILYTARLSLGALAGIMVGWFSFLLPQESTSFLGSVSPLAIAFLVGYNIDVFFNMMDIALNKLNGLRQDSEAAAKKEGVQKVPVNATASQSGTEVKADEFITPVADPEADLNAEPKEVPV